MTRVFGKANDYLSLIKFSHTIFAMPFAFVGFTLAIAHDGYPFSLRILLLVIACMVFARSAAMSFNRIADRSFDKLNPRTAKREIPSGKISLRNAIIFTIASSLLFIVSAALLNNLALILSPVALIIILGYSYTKRFTPLCHLFLGLGLSLAPIGAYIAVTGHFALLPLLFSGIVITWVSGFDIIYSLQDDEFDRETGLYSLPSVLNRKNALIVSVLLRIITVSLVVYIGIFQSSGILYWIGALTFFSLLLYQYLIVRPDDLTRVDLAFGTLNGIAGLLFSIFIILDLLI
ncbi:MAG TPA: UbiA-like polyprenyltransferase [Bacteroidales bacterium]|nr:UbiA-like polyprenyltransferase [Bacteroidales bacterium]HPT11737.1 UbiA-like polyprenyltransferase [Bacteroidales bacterium]